MGRSKREVAPPPPPSPSQASPGSFASGMMLPGSLGSGAWQGPAPPQPPHPLLYAYGAAASAFPMAQMKQGLDRSAIDLSDLQERYVLLILNGFGLICSGSSVYLHVD